MKTPKRSTKTPNPTPARAHIPALNPARLDLTLQALNSLPISASGKRAVAASLKAATNPQAEAPHVVIASLDKERRGRIEAAMKGYAAILNAPNRRGRAALQAISETEWQAAVDTQNAVDQQEGE